MNQESRCICCDTPSRRSEFTGRFFPQCGCAVGFVRWLDEQGRLAIPAPREEGIRVLLDQWLELGRPCLPTVVLEPGTGNTPPATLIGPRK